MGLSHTIYQRDRRTDGHRATAKTALTHSVARKNTDMSISYGRLLKPNSALKLALISF